MGDAIAMPVHWYYNLENIQKDYGGKIKGLTEPVDI
jgi:ADP-ribosyl-[dinitrogen reductase] hydrolase